MTPRRLSTLFVLLLTLVLLAACATASTSSAPGAAGASSPVQSADGEALTVTDAAGREITLQAEPRRIVSLAPSNTEIVCALDACDRLVGVTDFDDHPPEVVEIERVVTMAEVDVEAVVAAEPDLVLAAGNELTPTSVVHQLTDLGLPVLVLYPESLDEVMAEIELVGQALGRHDAAQALVREMEARVSTVTEAVAGRARPRTFYEVSVFEGTIYTAGEGSFLANLIETAGGDPITSAGAAGDTSIELEDLVAADPELILLGDATYDPTITPESVAGRPGWATMTAVENGAIKAIADDVVITRPGPRIVDGLEALARAIHPDAFAE